MRSLEKEKVQVHKNQILNESKDSDEQKKEERE